MRLIEILKILQNYGIDDTYPCWAEHDVIGFNVDPMIISDEDLESLEELGVFYNAEYEGLIILC